MSTTIQITTDNYDGQTAVITFTSDNGVFIYKCKQR